MWPHLWLAQRQQLAARTACFSGVADTQLRSDVREYLIAKGCARAPTVGTVAVTVAVGDPFGYVRARPAVPGGDSPARAARNSLMVDQEGSEDGARTLRLVSREDVARTGEDFQARAGQDGSHAT
jgi:hypothetical protein